MSNQKTGPFKILLVLNAIPLFILAGIGIAYYEGRLDVRVPKEGVAIISTLLGLGVICAVLGFFAAPAVDAARSRNRKARARIRSRLSRPGVGFGERLGLWLRRPFHWLYALVLTLESLGVYGALLITVLAITGVGALGAYTAYMMMSGQP